MRATVLEDGIQIEAGDVLITIRQHPEFGFKGNILQNTNGAIQVVDFHGDGFDGVVVHGPADWKNP